MGQLPRGPGDLYNARHSARKSVSASFQDEDAVTTPGCSNKHIDLNNVWILLERAKREEETSKETLFIRECSIHPDLFIVLANDRQLQQITQFCTNPNEFCIFGIDPTFNIFDKNISLTVTTYRNLGLENTSTNKPPVFIGPLLMHQRKDWKTYSKFAHALITQKPQLEGMLACGTDGEKALIDGFKRSLHFAIFLRCFLHFKDNIKRELAGRGLEEGVRKQYMQEIFGKQEGNVKYYGLVDCDTEDEFDVKLESLKEKWEERENNSQSSFYSWFVKEKV